MTEHRFISLTEHKPRETRWLWPNRIPCAAISLVEGDPGGNKSSLTYDVAARVTTGRPMYDCDGNSPAGTAILLQGEDTLDTMRRNLDAAGADLSKVFAYEKSQTSEADSLRLPEGMHALAAEIERRNARLVVVDPVTAFLSVNSTQDQAVRQVLQPLAAVAEHTGAAVVLVRHLTKSGGANPLYRGAGSVAFIGAARSALLVATDPGNPNQRVLAQTKASLAGSVPSLLFRPVTKADGVAIEWLGRTSYSALQLLEAGHTQARRELREATYVLYSILAEGPVPAKESKRVAAEAGITDRTLRRAKEFLGVVSQRKGFGAGSTFFWSLPRQHELVTALRKADLDELIDKLCHGESSESSSSGRADDPADPKSGRKPGDGPNDSGDPGLAGAPTG